MPLAQLLADYGYLAVFIGCLLEGETILVLAGFAAHQGYLSLPVTIAIAFLGGTLGDQIFFWVGRRWGKTLLNRFPRSSSRVQRVNELMTRYHAPVIVGIRFIYGLRILGPIVIGTWKLPAWRFAFFNMLGAAIWAPLIAGLGYGFGRALTLLLSDLADIEKVALGLIVGISVALTIIHQWRARSRE